MNMVEQQAFETTKIAPIFLTNKISATLIIPLSLARKYELNQPSHVVLEERDEGILIKKLKIVEEKMCLDDESKKALASERNSSSQQPTVKRDDSYEIQQHRPR
jgi:bifunctional DNA-binding transcriptional regulator/antitoxin component of YhaV-PrlF toxin-antitoxin module